METGLNENDFMLIVFCAILLVSTVVSSLANIQLKFDSMLRKPEVKENTLYSRRYLILGISLSAIGGVMDLLVIGYIPLSVRSCFSSLSIPISVILARMFLHERVSRTQMVGVLVTLCGTFVAVMFASHEKQKVSSINVSNVLLTPRVGWLALATLPPLVLALDQLSQRPGRMYASPTISLFLCAYATSFVAATVSLAGKFLSEVFVQEGMISVSVWTLAMTLVTGCVVQMVCMSSYLSRFEASRALPLYQVVNGIILSVFAAVIFQEPMPHLAGYVAGISLSFVGLWLLAAHPPVEKPKSEDVDNEPLIVVELHSPSKPAADFQPFMIL